jgi:hypothetical protein
LIAVNFGAAPRSLGGRRTQVSIKRPPNHPQDGKRRDLLVDQRVADSLVDHMLKVQLTFYKSLRFAERCELT